MAAGATPENCLYSFVELFIFKYLSDLGILKNHLSYNALMKMFESENEQTVLEYYANVIRKKIKSDLFPITSEDKTTIINGTIFVSKDEKAIEGYGTVFKKILKKLGDEKDGGGEFKNIDKDFKSKLFETFLKESISKKNWGQYFTPLKVVKSIVKMAESDIKPNITICDPACGVGKFLLEPLLINDNIERFYKVENGELKCNIKLLGMDKGFDKEEQKTIILAKANMLIYLSDMIRQHSDITSQFSKLFNDTFELKTKNILGTLRDTNYINNIDLILTNPPYVTSGSSNLKEEIIKSGIQNHYKINAMGVEGLFMEWIVRALKFGGKAFIIVPDGIFNRKNDKSLRQFILDECFIDGIISLPVKAFFTTPKKTYILCITKKSDKKQIQTEPVFTYLVSEIGETRDIYRFDIEQNDLNDAANQFNLFKGSKKYYTSTSLRCKVQPIQNFKSDNNWNIEKWWTEEEQIKLGLLKEETTTNIKEFPNIIEDIANNVLSLKYEIFLINENKHNIKFKDVSINDILNFIRGRVISKKHLNDNLGKYPVYSSNTKKDGILGYLNTFDFDCEGITWTTDGVHAGTTFYRNGKFSITNVCGLITVKEEFKNLIYLPFVNEVLSFKKIATGTDNKKVMTNVILNANLTIKIPINSQGLFDIDIQKQITEKYRIIEDVKKSIIDELNKINSIEINLDE